MLQPDMIDISGRGVGVGVGVGVGGGGTHCRLEEVGRREALERVLILETQGRCSAVGASQDGAREARPARGVSGQQPGLRGFRTRLVITKLY